MKDRLPPSRIPSRTLLLVFPMLVAVFAVACNGSTPTASNPVIANSAGGTAGANITAPGSLIDLEKATNGVDADEPVGPQIPVGDPVTWTYVVTNTGSLPVIGITVTDDQLGTIDCPRTTLSAGMSMTCTAVGVAGEGQYRNSAVVSGTNPQGVAARDEDVSHYFGIVPGVASIDLEKATNDTDADAAPGPVITEGQTLTWTYHVVNTGDLPLSDVAVSDDQLGLVVCPETTLDPGESMTCTVEGVAIEGQYENLGSVVATAADGQQPSDDDLSHYLGVPFASAPAIDLEKSTNGQDADQPSGPVLDVGDVVTWTYMVTNTGNIPLDQVAVTDNQLGAIACPQSMLDVGEFMTCTSNGVAVVGQYSNLGTATGTAPDGTVVNDADPSHYFGIDPVVGPGGCGQGYWKNHLQDWSPTPFMPSDLVNSVFPSTDVFPFIANSTLLEALQFNGGPGVDGAIRIMMRAAVTAALNATHPDLAYPRTLTEIVDDVAAAIATNDRQSILALHGQLSADNGAGCTLN